MIDLRGNKNFGFVFFFSLPVSTLLLLTAPRVLQPNTNSTPPLPGDSSSTTTRSAFSERHQLHHDAICLRHVTPTSLHRATHHHAIWFDFVLLWIYNGKLFILNSNNSAIYFNGIVFQQKLLVLCFFFFLELLEKNSIFFPVIEDERKGTVFSC